MSQFNDAPSGQTRNLQLNVLYQSDSNTQLGLGVSIASLLLNNSLLDIHIYIIDCGIESTFLQQLKEYITDHHGGITIIPSKILLKNKLVKQYPSYTGVRKNRKSYLKLFWSEVIDKKTDRLLYIDCDTIILSDLSYLAEVDLGGNCLGMVYDALITNEIEKIGLSPEDSYYNSGVILFNTEKWINGNCGAKIIEHLNNGTQYGTVDQDVLNVVFKGNIFTLPMQYNYQPIHMLASAAIYQKEFSRDNYYSTEEMEEARDNIGIVHFLKFIGQNPWDKGNLHPCRRVFKEYLERTPWAGTEFRRSKVRAVFVIEKLLYCILPKRLFLKVFHYAHRLMIDRSNRARALQEKRQEKMCNRTERS